MFRSRRISPALRGLVILCVCLLAVGFIPAQLVRAALIQQTIDNAIDEFKRGGFQRTSLGNLQSQELSPQVEDKAGAVQLGPMGILRGWQTLPYNLPTPLHSHGAAVIGNRIFVVGGSTQLNNQAQNVANVWSMPVNQLDGTFAKTQWDAEPNLPAVINGNRQPFNAPIAPISSAAVTAVQNADGSGYLYVIGGSVQSGTVDNSSYAVRMARVGTNGRISTWVDLSAGNAPNARIPSADPQNAFMQYGVQSASAMSFRAANGKTYVYLIGGLQRYSEQLNQVSHGSKAVFYAEVATDGRLMKPSAPSTPGWDYMPGLSADTYGFLPIVNVNNDNRTGLWGAVSIAERYPLAGDHLFVMGGQTLAGNSPAYNNSVFRARIQNNGVIQWRADNPYSTMPEARIGHAGVGFNGQFYVSGGQPNGTGNGDRSVLTSYVRDDGTLPKFDSTNFIKNDQALPSPRTLHASVIVRSTESARANAFVYVLGGRGSPIPGADAPPTAEIFYGKIGEDEDVRTYGYTPDGWYFSTPYDTNFMEAEVRKISWSAAIVRAGNTDIEMQYRTSLDNDCRNPTWIDRDWKDLDGSPQDAFRSRNAQNTVDLTGVQARCFQYRALLKTSDKFSTPSLLNVSLEIFIPGAPDLKVRTLAERPRSASGAFTGLNVVIENRNLVEKTLAADAEGPGDFFVDLFVFGPGETVRNPSLPIDAPGNTVMSKAYVKINKSRMQANGSFSVTGWCLTANDKSCSGAALASLFPRAGTYTVMVGVDSFGCLLTSFPGCVNESSQGGENNNLSARLQIVIPPAVTGCTTNCTPKIEEPGDWKGGGGGRTGVRLYLPMTNRP